MMWGYGSSGGWMWLLGVLMVIGIVLLILVTVRLWQDGGAPWAARQSNNGTAAVTDSARQILAERFARGELTAEQYRAQLAVLGETHT